jgi:cysteinyl-tRNA synthetase
MNKALNKLSSMIEPLVKEYNYDLEACDMAVTDMLKSDECAKSYDMVEILCNDINTPNFLTRLLAPQPFKNVAMLCHLIGFKPSVLYSHLQCEIPSYILELADKRESLKALKDWSAADDIRHEIVSKGFEIMDQKGGGFKINKII